MLNDFRNFLLKTSALIGCTATLLYFAPRLTNTITDDTTDEDQVSETTQDRKVGNRLEKYQNRRKPASVKNSKGITAKSLPNQNNESDISSSNNTNISYNNDNRMEDSSYRNISNSNSLSNTQSPINSNNRRSDLSNQQENRRNIRSTQSPNKGLTQNTEVTNENIHGVAACAPNCDSGQEESSSESEPSSTTSTSSSSSTTEREAPVVSADLGAGNYSTNPSVSLSSDIGGEIYYCLAEGSCCDPTPSAGGTAYSAAVDVGSADGNFCLSFVGVSTVGLLGDTVSRTYLVDQTLPNMSSVVDVQYIQTTQETNIAINSTDFGSSGFDYGLYNLSTDPSALNCKQIEEGYAHASYGVDLDGDSSPDLYDLSSVFATITSPLKPDIMQYGSIGNYFISILANRNTIDEAKRNCVTHRIILQDFDYLVDSQSTTAVPVINSYGNIEFSGSFYSYGIFREPAAIGDHSITSGSSKYEIDSSNILESSLEEIIN